MSWGISFTLWALHGALSNVGWHCQILCGFTWSQWWLQADPFPNSGPARGDQCLDVPRIGCVPCRPHMWSWGLNQFFRGCVTLSQRPLTVTNDARHQFLVEMLEVKVSWLLCLGRLVSKIDNVMHFACLVKQASVDYWRSFMTGQSVWHNVLRHLFTLWALHTVVTNCNVELFNLFGIVSTLCNFLLSFTSSFPFKY